MRRPIIRLYPRSFLGYSLATFALFAMPFLLAGAAGTYLMTRLANDSTEAIRSAMAVGESRRALAQQLGQLERVGRQFQVLGDETLREQYSALRAPLQRTLAEYHRAASARAEHDALARFVDAEQKIARVVLSAAPSSTEIGDALTRFDELASLLDTASVASDGAQTARMNKFHESAENLQRGFLWVALALLIAMPGLAAGLAVRLSRPVHSLNESIGALGRGQWDAPVRTQGPRDLVLIGRRLEWLRKRLRGLETQKTRFIQHVSHDLKTPLASLREGTSLLADGIIGELTVAQREVVDILSATGGRLQTLIEQLLAVADPGAPRPLVREPVRLAQLVRNVVDEQTLQWLTRRIQIDINGDPSEVQVDREMARVIVDNLLSNAIKHTPANGTIQIDLKEANSAVQIAVQDSGPGVDRNERDLIFEPFYTSSQDRNSTGTGLGLAIAREYARLHGGEVMLAPDGPGAHFVVSLPR